MPPKKRKINQDGGKGNKKMRKVIIDSESDETPEKEPKELTESEEEIIKKKDRRGSGSDDDEDEVIGEIGVYLLPVDKSANGFPTPPNGLSVGINRLQFPQQHPQLLNRLFSGDEFGQCQAQYKAQVRHLKLRFGEEEEQTMEMEEASTSNRYAKTSIRSGDGGGIADLLMKPSSSSQSLSQLASSPSNTKTEVFTGEGFSQHEMFSHAVGFFKEGKLFMLPIDKTYEMRKPLAGTIEKETTKIAQKASALKPSSSSAPNLAPLRIRFARAENEFQKRRREQSALFKQKLVQQDQWIPLRIEQAKLPDLYRKEIAAKEAEIGAAQKEASHSEQQQQQQEKPISIKDLLL